MALTFANVVIPTFNSKSVIAGQKGSSVCVDPLLIVNSTLGKFTITPAVSRALSLAPGDVITFGDTIDDVMRWIAAKSQDVVALFEANGKDINSPVDVEEVALDLRQFSIYKAFPQKNSDGSVKMVNARITKEEKIAYVEAHRAEIEAALTEAGVEITEENILAAVKGEAVPAYNGSKCASTSDMTGIGLTLSFTDSNMWNVMKADIDPDMRKVTKRTYKVDTKNPIPRTESDGYEMVEVIEYRLIRDENSDEIITARGSKGEAAEEAESAE